MSDLIEDALRSDEVIIPYEENNGLQVSTIIIRRGDTYLSYNFFDDPVEFLGPVKIQRSELSSEYIKSSLKGLTVERANVRNILVINSGVILAGRFGPFIEGVDLIAENGGVLKLRREGAVYPYCLVLEKSGGKPMQNG